MTAASRNEGSSNPVAGWIDLCVRLGVDRFFVASGSRCTPLTLAIARHPRAHVMQHFDERGLAFACLGYGRAAGRAAAFVCTSGTAVANALPAVIEASLDRVPMLLLTADRPPELRDTGANQTIDQVKLFGGLPRWQFDLPCPTSADIPTRFWHSCFHHAIRKSWDGPVHLNCMFREPFDLDVSAPMNSSEVTEPTINGQVAKQDVLSPVRWRPPCGKTLVVCGRCESNVAEAAARLAARLKCPLLADFSTGRRSLFYDLQLAAESHPAPDVVLQVGSRMVSKRLLSFLDQNPPTHYWLLTQDGERHDPLHRVTHVLRGNLISLCDSAIIDPVEVQNAERRVFCETWNHRSDLAIQSARAMIDGEVQITEPGVACTVAKLAPNGSSLFVGNSMPIRDFDTFSQLPDASDIRVFANRGASGIDGLIATACGIAHGLGRSTTAVVGDLSALHDLNSFSLVKRVDVPFVLIVINNDGGGIFHFLPVARQSDVFEPFFGTPHGRTFQWLAKSFDLEYENPQNIADFRQAYTAAIAKRGATLIEVHTDRQENHQLHERIRLAVKDAIGKSP